MKYLKEALNAVKLEKPLVLDGYGNLHIVSSGIVKPINDDYKAVLPDNTIVDVPFRSREPSVYIEFESEHFHGRLILLYTFHKGEVYTNMHKVELSYPIVNKMSQESIL